VVYSVIAVHPPSVALVTNAQAKTDKKAALALAQLHAAGMLHILHCVQDRLWTRNLAYHPHIHYLVPGGGIASDRQNWLPASEGLPGRRDRW
jgi:hypothetical protein